MTRVTQYIKSDGTIVRGHNRRGPEPGVSADATEAAKAACAAAEASPEAWSGLGDGATIFAEDAKAALGRHMTASEIAASGQTYRAYGWRAEPRTDGGAAFHVEIGADGPVSAASELPAGMEWRHPKGAHGTPVLAWVTDDDVDLLVSTPHDAGVRLEGSGKGNAVRRGTGNGIVVRAGSGEGNAENYITDENAYLAPGIRDMNYGPSASPYGSDALREGDGRGNAIRHGGPGDARREGSGDGDAEKSGPGTGDARNNSSGFGNAINNSSGAGVAFRDGSGHGHAKRTGDGYGNAYNASTGIGDALRDGDGDGDATRVGPGHGSARRDGSGMGGAFRHGKGNGGAIIDGSAVGSAVRAGMGNGNAESTTTGNSDVFKIGPGNGKALRWNGDGSTYVSGKRNKEAISYRGSGGKGDAFLASDCRGAATNKSEVGGNEYIDDNWRHWRVPSA